MYFEVSSIQNGLGNYCMYMWWKLVVLELYVYIHYWIVNYYCPIFYTLYVLWIIHMHLFIQVLQIILCAIAPGCLEFMIHSLYRGVKKVLIYKQVIFCLLFCYFKLWCYSVMYSTLLRYFWCMCPMNKDFHFFFLPT